MNPNPAMSAAIDAKANAEKWLAYLDERLATLRRERAEWAKKRRAAIRRIEELAGGRR